MTKFLKAYWDVFTFLTIWVSCFAFMLNEIGEEIAIILSAAPK